LNDISNISVLNINDNLASSIRYLRRKLSSDSVGVRVDFNVTLATDDSNDIIESIETVQQKIISNDSSLPLVNKLLYYFESDDLSSDSANNNFTLALRNVNSLSIGAEILIRPPSRSPSSFPSPFPSSSFPTTKIDNIRDGPSILNAILISFTIIFLLTGGYFFYLRHQKSKTNIRPAEFPGSSSKQVYPNDYDTTTNKGFTDELRVVSLTEHSSNMTNSSHHLESDNNVIVMNQTMRKDVAHT
jgi:hypothetical protein